MGTATGVVTMVDSAAPRTATTGGHGETEKESGDNDNGFIAFDENNADDTATAVATTATTTKTEFHAMESSTTNCRNNNNDDPILDLTEQMTKFLALDKCLPRRQFLSIINLKSKAATAKGTGRKGKRIGPNSNDTSNEKSLKMTEEDNTPKNTCDNNDDDHEGNNSNSNNNNNEESIAIAIQQQEQHEKEKEEIKKKKDNERKNEYCPLEYDPEWLAIVRKTHHWNSTQRRRGGGRPQRVVIPSTPVAITNEDIEWIIQRL